MDKQEQLRDRLDKNLSNYHEFITGFDKPEIIEMAGQIAAMSDAHYYLQNHHDFDAEQTAYLLQFDNPLEVVADAWKQRTEDISDMSFVLDEVFEKQDALAVYPLFTGGTVNEIDLRKPESKAPDIANTQDEAKQPAHDAKNKADKPSLRNQLAEASKGTAAHPEKMPTDKHKANDKGER